MNKKNKTNWADCKDVEKFKTLLKIMSSDTVIMEFIDRPADDSIECAIICSDVFEQKDDKHYIYPEDVSYIYELICSASDTEQQYARLMNWIASERGYKGTFKVSAMEFVWDNAY